MKTLSGLPFYAFSRALTIEMRRESGECAKKNENRVAKVTRSRKSDRQKSEIEVRERRPFDKAQALGRAEGKRRTEVRFLYNYHYYYSKFLSDRTDVTNRTDESPHPD